MRKSAATATPSLRFMRGSFLKINFLMNFCKSLLIIYLSFPLGDTLLPFMNKALSIAAFVTNIGPFTAQYIHDIIQITTIYSAF